MLDRSTDDIPPTPSGTITALHKVSSISKDRLKFGHVPLGVILRDLVAVQNTTQDRRVSFSWDFTSDPMVESMLKIEPSAGVLEPGESRICRVVFTPDRQPRLYEMDVQCFFFDDDEMVINLN